MTSPEEPRLRALTAPVANWCAKRTTTAKKAAEPLQVTGYTLHEKDGVVTLEFTNGGEKVAVQMPIGDAERLGSRLKAMAEIRHGAPFNDRAPNDGPAVVRGTSRAASTSGRRRRSGRPPSTSPKWSASSSRTTAGGGRYASKTCG
jgi:hypothetical protein